MFNYYFRHFILSPSFSALKGFIYGLYYVIWWVWPIHWIYLSYFLVGLGLDRFLSTIYMALMSWLKIIFLINNIVSFILLSVLFIASVWLRQSSLWGIGSQSRLYHLEGSSVGILRYPSLSIESSACVFGVRICQGSYHLAPELRLRYPSYFCVFHVQICLI